MSSVGNLPDTPPKQACGRADTDPATSPTPSTGAANTSPTTPSPTATTGHRSSTRLAHRPPRYRPPPAAAHNHRDRRLPRTQPPHRQRPHRPRTRHYPPATPALEPTGQRATRRHRRNSSPTHTVTQPWLQQCQSEAAGRSLARTTPMRLLGHACPTARASRRSSPAAATTAGLVTNRRWRTRARSCYCPSFPDTPGRLFICVERGSSQGCGCCCGSRTAVVRVTPRQRVAAGMALGTSGTRIAFRTGECAERLPERKDAHPGHEAESNEHEREQELDARSATMRLCQLTLDLPLGAMLRAPGEHGLREDVVEDLVADVVRPPRASAGSAVRRGSRAPAGRPRPVPARSRRGRRPRARSSSPTA